MKRSEKRMTMMRRIELLVLLAVGMILLISGIYFYKGQKATNSIGSSQEAVSDSEGAGFFEENTVVYNGKTYKRNTYIKAILCMGIDRTGTMTETVASGTGGQADGIILVAHDTARDSLRYLMIPRDTMTPITLTDRSGNVLGKDVQHLTLAYAYGDGRETSCEYVTEAVSDLLCGFPIDYYMAADMDAISIVNDLVGGVTVTVPTEGMEAADPSFVYGETVTLHGKQAEKFVRYRDITRDHSALYRMDQQQEYIEQFLETVREQSRGSDGLIVRLFEGIQENMVTNMEKAEYLKTAMSGLTRNSTSEITIFTLPGKGVTTGKYDEYYPDENGMKEVILNLFYREEE